MGKRIEEARRKMEEIKIREKMLEVQEGLPHLHGFPFYVWARKFYESLNLITLLCAANQISKSSTQIRKLIRFATDKDLWNKINPDYRPRQFWMLYPTKEVATIEFEQKWVTEFLPRNKFESSDEFGWTHQKKNKTIYSLDFKSGVSVFFKSYETDVMALQSGSVDALFLDEEIDEDLFPELTMRLAARQNMGWGFLNAVFTATKGQDFWRRAIEEHGKHETFRDACKQQVTMFDCLEYEDGSPTPWTLKRIEQLKQSLPSEAEIQRRLFGKFVLSEGLSYQAFIRKKNVRDFHPLPKNWHIYVGVDIGGGGTSHPAAICFLGVNPEHTKGRVFRGWKGGRNETTTSEDILYKFRALKGKLNCTSQRYDHQSKDFHTFATRAGEPFVPADKARDSGQNLINTLFKNGALIIYDMDELRPLILELESLLETTSKPRAKDDFIDALRFAVTAVPWNIPMIIGDEVMPSPTYAENDPVKSQIQQRRKQFIEKEPTTEELIDREFDEWNEQYEV